MKASITVRPYLSKINTPALVKWLLPAFAVRHPFPWSHPAYRAGHWDGYKHFLNKRGEFATGLLPKIVRLAQKSGVAIEFEGRYQPIAVNPTNYYGPPLRPYQIAAIDAVTTNQVGGMPFLRGIIEVPTAGGKSLILAGLLARLQMTALILVDSKELMYQLQEDLQKALKQDIGIIGDGQRSLRPITVGIIDSLATATPAFLLQFQVLCFDECHHGSSATAQHIFRGCAAHIRVGFSATPFNLEEKLHSMRVRGTFGDVLYSVPLDQLIADGFVASVELYWKPLTQLGTKETEKLKFKRGDNDAYDKLIVRNDERNQIFIDFALSRKASTLILVEALEHGKLLAQATGWDFLSSKDTSTKRRRALVELADGSRPGVIATTIFDEGINVPAIKYIGLAGGLKSARRFKQRIGRGMRVSGTEPVRGLDILDLANPYLRDQAESRVITGKKAGYQMVYWDKDVKEIP